MQTPREVAESYWAAECARDIPAILKHYHSDATFCPPGQILVGHEEIKSFYESSGADFPGLSVQILHEFSSENEAALEWRAELVSTSNKSYTILGVNIIKVRDGKFESVHAYFDPTVLNSGA